MPWGKGGCFFLFSKSSHSLLFTWVLSELTFKDCATKREKCARLSSEPPPTSLKTSWSVQGFTKGFTFFFILSKRNHSLARTSECRLNYLETHLAFLVSSVLYTELQPESVHTFFRSTSESKSENQGEKTSARLKCYVFCGVQHLLHPKKKGPCSVKFFNQGHLQLAKAHIHTSSSSSWSPHALFLKALGNNRECCKMNWLPNFSVKPWH